jgi:hypothetical protein
MCVGLLAQANNGSSESRAYSGFCSIKWLGALLPWMGCLAIAGYLPSYYWYPFITPVSREALLPLDGMAHDRLPHQLLLEPFITSGSRKASSIKCLAQGETECDPAEIWTRIRWRSTTTPQFSHRTILMLVITDAGVSYSRGYWGDLKQDQTV